MPAATTAIAPLALLDDLLEPWRSTLGEAFDGYRNHCQRMAALTLALLPAATDEDRQKVAIAACFHDLGIWSDGTLDYLPPSARQARAALAAQGRLDWADEIEQMIDQHHKLRRWRGAYLRRVEAFRKADLIDVSLGLVRFGVPAATIATLKRQYPNAGFHRTLLRLASGWFRRHPLRPPPFLKW